MSRAEHCNSSASHFNGPVIGQYNAGNDQTIESMMDKMTIASVHYHKDGIIKFEESGGNRKPNIFNKTDKKTNSEQDKDSVTNIFLSTYIPTCDLSALSYGFKPLEEVSTILTEDGIRRELTEESSRLIQHMHKIPVALLPGIKVDYAEWISSIYKRMYESYSHDYYNMKASESKFSSLRAFSINEDISAIADFGLGQWIHNLTFDPNLTHIILFGESEMNVDPCGLKTEMASSVSKIVFKLCDGIAKYTKLHKMSIYDEQDENARYIAMMVAKNFINHIVVEIDLLLNDMENNTRYNSRDNKDFRAGLEQVNDFYKNSLYRLMNDRYLVDIYERIVSSRNGELWEEYIAMVKQRNPTKADVLGVQDEIEFGFMFFVLALNLSGINDKDKRTNIYFRACQKMMSDRSYKLMVQWSHNSQLQVRNYLFNSLSDVHLELLRLFSITCELRS